MSELSRPPNPTAADPLADISAVVERAARGDATALPALRQLLNNSKLARIFGDLACQVRNVLIYRVADNNLALREAAIREMDRLRTELAGPNPTPLERLLVERVAVGWLQVHEADWTLSLRAATPAAEFLQKRSDHAQRRLLAAVRALATIRKLALPALQVNIADQQVNVTG